VNAVAVAVSGTADPPGRAAVAQLCRRALAAAGIDGWDLSVLLCSDETIRELNARYRGKDQATDVLSFSQGEGMRIAVPARQRPAGDLVISVDTLRRGAAERGTREDGELERLVVHGILHLAGMDHGRGRGRAMRDRERKLTAALAAGRRAGAGGGGP
jgi:probable rRNA maturation factor